MVTLEVGVSCPAEKPLRAVSGIKAPAPLWEAGAGAGAGEGLLLLAAWAAAKYC